MDVALDTIRFNMDTQQNKMKCRNENEAMRAFHTYTIFLTQAIDPRHRKNYYIAITANENGNLEFELKENKQVR